FTGPDSPLLILSPVFVWNGSSEFDPRVEPVIAQADIAVRAQEKEAGIRHIQRRHLVEDIAYAELDGQPIEQRAGQPAERIVDDQIVIRLRRDGVAALRVD